MKYQDLESRPALSDPPAPADVAAAAAASATGTKPTTIHQLIFFNHWTPDKLWLVNSTDTSVTQQEIYTGSFNSYFLAWCSEWTLDPAKVLGYIKVAADQSFLVPYNDNWATPFGLPQLTQVMIDTMDNERWYVAQIQN